MRNKLTLGQMNTKLTNCILITCSLSPAPTSQIVLWRVVWAYDGIANENSINFTDLYSNGHVRTYLLPITFRNYLLCIGRRGGMLQHNKLQSMKLKIIL